MLVKATEKAENTKNTEKKKLHNFSVMQTGQAFSNNKERKENTENVFLIARRS